LLVRHVVHRKALAIEEVKAILRESGRSLPAIRLWLPEGLEEAIRDVWKQSSASLEGSTPRIYPPAL
jgi:hypothetical protein